MHRQHAPLGYPVTLDRVPKGTYTVQAVIDLAPDRHQLQPPRRATSTPSRRASSSTRRRPAPSTLHLDQVYKEPPFKETDRVKLVEIESKLLTDFHKRPTRLRAGVVLPASYAKNPTKKYPVVYEIPGFSGNHRMSPAARSRAA